jgi:hypothetical protein
MDSEGVTAKTKDTEAKPLASWRFIQKANVGTDASAPLAGVHRLRRADAAALIELGFAARSLRVVLGLLRAVLVVVVAALVAVVCVACGIACEQYQEPATEPAA